MCLDTRESKDANQPIETSPNLSMSLVEHDTFLYVVDHAKIHLIDLDSLKYEPKELKIFFLKNNISKYLLF